jgi:hypothetical protein
MQTCDNAVVGEKLTCCESSVRGCVVIMEQPIACAPQFRSCMFKSHVRIVCTVPYDTLTISAMSLMVLRRSSCTRHRIVSAFLGVELVEGRPDLSLSSIDVLPLLKRACHSKHVARHVASLPYARRIISKVSTPDLPSLTQNLMFALCSSFSSMLKSQM